MPTAGGAPSWSTVENLVGQRSRAFEYLKRVQQGDTHWLSTVALGPQEGPLHKGVDSATVLRWFYLGLSIGPLLQLQSGPPFVKAVLQLLEELHYHFANRAAQNMKVIKANVRGRAHHEKHHHGHDSAGGSADDLKPQLQRAGGEVLYAYLLTPHIAHQLSASQVLLCLCELMPHCYRKLGEAGAAGAPPPTAALAESIIKIDGVVAETILHVAAKQYSASSQGALQQALSRADPLFARLMVAGDGGDARDLD